jgi:hypothetical protein
MMRLAINEAHQGVMTDRQHSLKRGDRLSKKERQTTASDLEKATNCNKTSETKRQSSYKMSDKQTGLHPCGPHQ